MPVRRTRRDATSGSGLSAVPETHETLESAIESLAVHDHLCLIYESQEEQFAAVVPFMRHGLAAGQACMYIADDNTADAVGAALRSGGIDTDAESARGALRILTKRESYLRDGRFDPDAMIAFLAEATAEARADGFSALRVTGEMTWALGGEPGTERLFEYEAKLNYFIPDHDALVICQYNRSRFEPDVILNVIRTHPVVISGGLVCDNCHYVPPDDFLQRDQPGREVDKLLNSIVDAERSRQALEQASRDWSATFDAMNDMVCLLARDGTVLRCNESMVKLLGLARMRCSARNAMRSCTAPAPSSRSARIRRCSAQGSAKASSCRWASTGTRSLPIRSSTRPKRSSAPCTSSATSPRGGAPKRSCCERAPTTAA